jgi:hypothetical protein
VSSTGGDPSAAGAVHPNLEDLWWAKAIARRMHAGVVTGAEPGNSPGNSPGYSPGAEARRVSSELMRAREARVALLFERARRATRAPFRAIPQPPKPEPIPRRRRAERPAPHPPLRLLWASPGFQMGNSLAEFVEARAPSSSSSSSRDSSAPLLSHSQRWFSPGGHGAVMSASISDAPTPSLDDVAATPTRAHDETRPTPTRAHDETRPEAAPARTACVTKLDVLLRADAIAISTAAPAATPLGALGAALGTALGAVAAAVAVSAPPPPPEARLMTLLLTGTSLHLTRLDVPRRAAHLPPLPVHSKYGNTTNSRGSKVLEALVIATDCV